MADANCFSKGDPVSWHYRSAIGHGYVRGVSRQENTCAATLYSINQVDHHPGEPAIVYHTGDALSHSTREAVEAARRDEGKAGGMLRTKDVSIGHVKAGPADGLADGQFSAYVSVFGNVDSYGDVVQPGAFADTLSQWKASGNPIPLLWGHDMADPFSNIGGVTTAEEDAKGLKVTAQLDLDNPKSQQVYRLLKGRRVNQMSFAYDVLAGAPAKDEERGEFYSLDKLKLYEVSVVPIGANQETEVLAVKANADALASGVKAGRVLAQKHIDSLRTAQEAIGAVIAAAEATDDQEKASGTPKANTDASAEEPERANASVSAEELKASPSVDTFLAVISIEEKGI